MLPVVRFVSGELGAFFTRKHLWTTHAVGGVSGAMTELAPNALGIVRLWDALGALVARDVRVLGVLLRFRVELMILAPRKRAGHPDDLALHGRGLERSKRQGRSRSLLERFIHDGRSRRRRSRQRRGLWRRRRRRSGRRRRLSGRLEATCSGLLSPHAFRCVVVVRSVPRIVKAQTSCVLPKVPSRCPARLCMPKTTPLIACHGLGN